MTLGEQFKNTFFLHNGSANYFTDPASLPQEEGKSAGHNPLIQNGPENLTTGHNGVAYQGMLFDPHTGTGSNKDPLVSSEQRTEIFKNALNISNPENYAENAKRYLKTAWSKKNTESDIDAITRAGVQSGIPSNIAERADVNVVLHPKVGRAHYNYRNNTIRLHPGLDELVSTGNTIPAHTKPTLSFDRESTAHYNPDWKNIKGIEHVGSYNLKRLSQGKVMTPTGERDITNEDMREGLLNLPEGHYLNIWEGKGENTDKHHSTFVKAQSGYTESGRRKFINLHYRFPLKQIGQVEVPERPEQKSVRTTFPPTLVHEVGHSLDPNVRVKNKATSKADPMNEAVADGFRDRYSTYADSYERALEPSEDRIRELGPKGNGYGIGHKEFPKNMISKALYAAVRQHVAIKENNYLTLPNRDDLVRQYNKNNEESEDSVVPISRLDSNIDYKPHLAQELALGHMYTHHAHVRSLMESLDEKYPGIHNVARNAAETYRSQITDAGRSSGVQFHQLPIPGME